MAASAVILAGKAHERRSDVGDGSLLVQACGGPGRADGPLRLGVRRTQGKIVTVSRDPETGSVTNFFLRLDGEGKVLDLREDELRTID